jgi:predicted aspartyl protease
MKTRFPYREDSSSILGRVARPMAEVLLRASDASWIRVAMYVDSAADFTVIPLKLGEALGLKYRHSEIREIKGMGKKPVQVVIKKLQMKIAGKSIYAQVAWSLIEEVPVILGRRDVFDLFRVTIDQAKQTVTFE